MATRSVRTLDAAFHKMLDEETRPIPESFRRDSPIGPGPTFVPVKSYYSQEFFDLEVEKLWKRVWQMAAHEDDLPNVGDYLPYDIAGMSFLIVKSGEDEYKAFYNSCLHRGRKLREHRGKQADELRCPFHGWAWKLDGTIKQIPCEWDFLTLREKSNHYLKLRLEDGVDISSSTRMTNVNLSKTLLATYRLILSSFPMRTATKRHMSLKLFGATGKQPTKHLWSPTTS